MWYAIVAGSGLAVGLSLMVWALRERSARFAAQREAIRQVGLRHRFELQAETNARVSGELEEQVARLERQARVATMQLESARRRLVACRDPKAVLSWLDSELKPPKV